MPLPVSRWAQSPLRQTGGAEALIRMGRGKGQVWGCCLCKAEFYLDKKNN